LYIQPDPIIGRDHIAYLVAAMKTKSDNASERMSRRTWVVWKCIVIVWVPANDCAICCLVSKRSVLA
jgi:hypothetical protein